MSVENSGGISDLIVSATPFWPRTGSINHGCATHRIRLRGSAPGLFRRTVSFENIEGDLHCASIHTFQATIEIVDFLVITLTRDDSTLVARSIDIDLL